VIRTSLIVPTYNRLPRLKKIIAALEQQSCACDDFEVIFVADGCSDGTEEYLSQLASPLQQRLVIQANSGPAAARNRGAQEAQGDLLLFLDDDVVPDPDLVRQHLLSHADASPSTLVTGPMLTPPDERLSAWTAYDQSLLMRYYAGIQHGRYQPGARLFYTGNASLQRAFFFTAGGFDTQFRRSEDVEFAFRADRLGAVYRFNPDARGVHYPVRSFEAWSQTAYRYGENDVLFTREKGVDWLLPQQLREYTRRSPLLKAIPFYLDMPQRQQQQVWRLCRLGEVGYRWGISPLWRLTFSAIYKIRYYQGMADCLGGKDIFEAMALQKSRVGQRVFPPR
jgi:glycosyltransferase involved in cell wall biosynthesis